MPYLPGEASQIRQRECDALPHWWSLDCVTAPFDAMEAPPFLPRGARVLEQNLWLGSAEGTSALHADPFDNVLVVVRGEHM